MTMAVDNSYLNTRELLKDYVDKKSSSVTGTIDDTRLRLEKEYNTIICENNNLSVEEIREKRKQYKDLCLAQELARL